MTTPDDRDDLRRVARAVRAASGPAPDDDLARRVADGAWERAGMPAARPRRRSPPRAFRRLAVAAAAVLAVGGALLAVRPTEPVFAVEGEPVRVWREGGWHEARRVSPGTTVRATESGASLRGCGSLAGDVIVPEPGATFRILAGEEGARTLTVQLLGGAAEVRGGRLRLALADVEVAPRREDAPFGAWATVPAADDAATGAAREVDAARAALGRVRMRFGDATLVRRSTGERLELGGEQMAALLPIDQGGRTVYRLSRLRAFGPSVGVLIAHGHPVLDVRASREGAIAVLGGPDDAVTGISIGAAELPAALDQIHIAMLAFVSEMELDSRGRGAGPRGAVAARSPPSLPDLVARAEAAGETVVEVSLTRGGGTVRVLRRGDGAVEVHRGDGSALYPSLDAARDADPEAARLLEPHVDR